MSTRRPAPKIVLGFILPRSFLPATHDGLRDEFGTTEELLREYFWHRAATDADREAWGDRDNGELLRLMAEHEDVREKVRERSIAVHAEIDRRLKEVLDGTDARTVFKFGRRKRQGESVPSWRDQHIAMEVLRLSLIEGYEESEAIEAMAQHLTNSGTESPDGDPNQKVQRALRKWKGHAWFSPERVQEYSESLREMGYLA